jgi:lipopolysaccharide transport system permease protein
MDMVTSLARIARFPAALYLYRGLIATLVRRELKGRYLNSAFGGVWAVLNPIVMLVVYTFVFSGILPGKVPVTSMPAETAESHFAFALYLFCGMIPWLAFAEGLHRSTSIVIENSNLIKKVAFPSEILPVYVVLYTVVNEAIGLGLLIVASVIFFQKLSIFVVFYPVLLALKLLFSFGIAYFFAGFNVFVRDFSHVIGLFLTLWMFLTPIFYFRETIPEHLRWLLALNPMYHLINGYRDVFLNARMPAAESLAIFLAFALAVFAGGYLFFLGTKHKFADEI